MDFFSNSRWVVSSVFAARLRASARVLSAVVLLPRWVKRRNATHTADVCNSAPKTEAGRQHIAAAYTKTGEYTKAAKLEMSKSSAYFG